LHAIRTFDLRQYCSDKGCQHRCATRAGEKYHPLPWSTLKYDERKGGYIINLDKRMLENAPTYDMDEGFRWTPDYGRQVDKYYNAPTYW
jgi:hypothetical protein